MRIISTAFTCEEGRGSEYEVGYRWSQALGKIFETVTLTRRKSYLSLDTKEFFHSNFGLVKKISNTYYKSIDIPYAHILLKGRSYMRIHYILWMLIVSFWIKKNKKNFNINHHICFVSTWFPPTTFFANLPFIWGPIGSGGPLPKWAINSSLYSFIWQFVTQILPNINFLGKYIADKSEFIIAINSHVLNLICPSKSNKKEIYNLKKNTNHIVFPSIAINKRNFEGFNNEYQPIQNSKIIWSGRNVPFKLPKLVFKTAELLIEKYPNISITLIGEGMEQYNDPRKKIKFIRTIPQKDFFSLLSKSNLLLTPTTEGAGFVSLEALSYGVPLVCLNNSGAAEFIGSDGGISCPISNTLSKTANDLVFACEKVMESKKVWEEFRLKAFERHKLFTWENLEINLKQIYKTKFLK